MAAVGRLENPFRLSGFGGSGLAKKETAVRVGENEHKDNDRCREEDSEHSWYEIHGVASSHEQRRRTIEENGNR